MWRFLLELEIDDGQDRQDGQEQADAEPSVVHRSHTLIVALGQLGIERDAVTGRNIVSTTRYLFSRNIHCQIGNHAVGLSVFARKHFQPFADVIGQLLVKRNPEVQVMDGVFEICSQHGVKEEILAVETVVGIAVGIADDILLVARNLMVGVANADDAEFLVAVSRSKLPSLHIDVVDVTHIAEFLQALLALHLLLHLEAVGKIAVETVTRLLEEDVKRLRHVPHVVLVNHSLYRDVFVIEAASVGTCLQAHRQQECQPK